MSIGYLDVNWVLGCQFSIRMSIDYFDIMWFLRRVNGQWQHFNVFTVSHIMRPITFISKLLQVIWMHHTYVVLGMIISLSTYRRFRAIVSQLKISLFSVIYIIQKPRYCCVGRRKLVTLHALFGNQYDQIYFSFFSNCEEIKLSKAPPEK